MRKNTDRKGHGMLGAVISAAIFVALCLVGIFVVFRIPEIIQDIGWLGVAALWLLPLMAVMIGVVIALGQRWREVEDGEEDEARKY